MTMKIVRTVFAVVYQSSPDFFINYSNLANKTQYSLYNKEIAK